MKNNIDWESVGKRIVSLRAINNMSREDLASKIGSSVSTVFRIESGLPPTSQYLILIASAFKVSVEYLTGLSDDPRSGIKNEAELVEVKQKKVPLFEVEVSAGNGIFPDAFYIHEYIDAPVGTDYAFRVAGDSMLPILDAGDVVFVKANPEPAVGRMVVALFDGMIVVKWLIKNNGGYLLQPENTLYSPFYPAEGIRFEILGTVESVLKQMPIKKMKNYSKGG